MYIISTFAKIKYIVFVIVIILKYKQPLIHFIVIF